MPVVRGRVVWRVLFLLLVAVAAASAAALLTRQATGDPTILRAIGGSVAVKPAGAEPLVAWPGTTGWTIVLVSVPKREGRDEALAVAEAARARDLPDVGILDSSRYASVRPGFWMVFTGVYGAEAEATGALRAARALVKTARVQRLAR
jgi:hypothetical protein